MPNGGTVATRVSANERSIAIVETKLTTLIADGAAMRTTIDRIEGKLNGRPSWPVTIYITVTTSIVTGLLALLAASLTR